VAHERAHVARRGSPVDDERRIRRAEEGQMCPACIANTAVIIAGAGSSGAILAVCIGRFRRGFRGNRLGLFHKKREN
jgi:hypothetical protein